MTKLIPHAVAIFLAFSFSTVSMSANPPTVPGTLYTNGPISPLFANTGLSAAEKAAYALYEGVMQIAEAKIHATSCSSSAGTSTVEIFTDGSQGNRPFNFIDVISNGGSFTLDANLKPPSGFRGQKISIDQNGTGFLAGRPVNNYRSRISFNESNNIMWGSGRMDVTGINGFSDRYHSKVIKNYSRGSINSQDSDYFTISTWGLQSLDKLGFPVNKYWQRSKSRRSNGSAGRSVLVKDRLVGSTSCRITIDTEGSNNPDFFWQEGNLTIEMVNPSAQVHF